MTLGKRIQNYFELHSSFVGFNKMPYCTQLKDIIHKCRNGFKELCYMYLNIDSLSV